ncbi:Uncharacterised protein [Serratia fonticola]|uniref:Uncharacterized protein n=1 Tax=Serratia fonticola TaxID=47917 RepID=A0A4U9TMM0_SERFO|nr:Uncharacterised protein [Serratia fonticola]
MLDDLFRQDGALYLHFLRHNTDNLQERRHPLGQRQDRYAASRPGSGKPASQIAI